MLVKEWIDSVTPEKIDRLAAQFDVDPRQYCRNPYKKSLSGGSDSHMAFFSGLTGTYLYIPNLRERLRAEPKSRLALEALRRGDMIPYGSHQASEKLTIAFLHYVCQVALNYKDPGLLRLLLHEGKAFDKISYLLVSNAFAEMQRHKVTMSFVNILHDCFLGQSPSFLKKLTTPSAYMPVFNDVVQLAEEQQGEKGLVVEKYSRSIFSINRHLNELLFSRLARKIAKMLPDEQPEAPDFAKIITRFELPSYLRAYIETDKKNPSSINLNNLLDGLPFPFFASLILLSSHFAGTKVLFNTRQLLKEFSAKIDKYQHPERALWLTDTFEDKNGVSSALQAMHREIKRRGLPVDLLVCSDTLKSDAHLIVVKPVCEFQVPFYPDQPARMPNFVEIHNLFYERGYDRVICSTEGPMGAMGLYLKHAYSVPANFFIHTDWMTFARKTLNFNRHNLSSLRRFLRVYYGAFDRLFVLNNEQRCWLTGREMNFAEDKVRLTAHWADDIFRPEKASKQKVLGIDADRPVMLYVGRVSKEKGVLELPRIYKAVKKAIPGVALAVVGQGPAYGQLQKELPEGYYFDWASREQLPAMYSAADILVFPSKFDTFSCAVLESLSCGLPVIAYDTKGPKDIIDNGVCGYLVDTEEQMAEKIIAYLGDRESWKDFRKAATQRAGRYDVNGIVDRFTADIGL